MQGEGEDWATWGRSEKIRKDPSKGYKVTQGYIMQALRHAVPGDYKSILEARAPGLEEMGIDLQSAVLLQPCDLLSEVFFRMNPGRSKALKSLVDYPDQWHLCLASRESTSMASLQCACHLTEAGEFLARLSGMGLAKEPVCFKTIKGKTLVLINGTTLKQIARTTTEL